MNERIKQLILDRFIQTKSSPNHVIDDRILYHNIVPKLNPKEQDELEPTINGMQDEGIITIENRSGSECLVLTKAGYDKIYPIDEDDAIEKIGQLILDRFAKTNSKVGHMVNDRWLGFELLEQLNPKEQDLIEIAVNKLIADDYVEFGNKGIVLTQGGFDKIY